MCIAIRERQIRAGHATEVGAPRHGVKKIFNLSLSELNLPTVAASSSTMSREATGPKIFVDMRARCALLHASLPKPVLSFYLLLPARRGRLSFDHR
jgi:hypothetical protein